MLRNYEDQMDIQKNMQQSFPLNTQKTSMILAQEYSNTYLQFVIWSSVNWLLDSSTSLQAVHWRMMGGGGRRVGRGRYYLTCTKVPRLQNCYLTETLVLHRRHCHAESCNKGYDGDVKEKMKWIASQITFWHSIRLSSICSLHSF